VYGIKKIEIFFLNLFAKMWIVTRGLRQFTLTAQNILNGQTKTILIGTLAQWSVTENWLAAFSKSELCLFDLSGESLEPMRMKTEYNCFIKNVVINRLGNIEIETHDNKGVSYINTYSPEGKPLLNT
jgi:hypothetical protein